MALSATVTCGRPGEPPPSPKLVSANADAAALHPPSAFDLEGHPVDLFKLGKGRGIVLVFVSNDCPISNRYAPEIRRLKLKYAKRGIRFWIVHPDPDESAQAIAQHAKEYQTDCPELRDPHHILVARAKARVTPEAAVFSAEGKLIYHGRIDNRTVAFGVDRPAATRHDLDEVLTALSGGKPTSENYAPPVGCYISE